MDEQVNISNLQALAKYYLEKSIKLEQDFVLFKLQSESIIEALQQQIREFGKSGESGKRQSANKPD